MFEVKMVNGNVLSLIRVFIALVLNLHPNQSQSFNQKMKVDLGFIFWLFSIGF